MIRKKQTRFFGWSIFFILILPAVFSHSVSYETNTVSRVVGSDTNDILNQLDVYEMDLNHASYYGQFQSSYGEKADVLESLFGVQVMNESRWDYDDVAEDLSQFQIQELLVIEAEGGIEDGMPFSTREKSFLYPETTIFPKDVDAWKEDFARTYPVFIFDSEYAGLSIPSTPTFVNELTRYSTMIAPTSVNSREFVFALLCNLGNEKSIGKTFKNARNAYYQYARPSDNEFLGITLLSYSLYGVPFVNISTPEYTESELQRICENYFIGSDSNILNADPEKRILSKKSLKNVVSSGNAKTQDVLKISQDITFDYELVDYENFTIIESEILRNKLEQLELVLPFTTINEKFPSRTVITDITYQYANPVRLHINLPQWQGEYVDAQCYYNEKNESFDVTYTFTENDEIVALHLNPLKVVNCTNKTFDFYTSVHYEIEHIPYSPVFIENVNYPKSVVPGKNFNITVDVKNTQIDTVEGFLELYQEENLIFEKENFTNEITTITIPVRAEDEEKISKYVLKFVQDNKVLTENSFRIKNRVFDYEVDVSSFDGNGVDVSLNIFNYGDAVETTIKDILLKDSVLQRSVRNEILSTGENQLAVRYDGLSKENQTYEVLFDILYGNRKLTVGDQIITNHYPLLFIPSVIFAEENSTIVLNYSVEDSDGDYVEVEISGFMNSSTKNVTFEDAGEYDVTFTLNDGLLTTLQNIRIVVEDVNRFPELEQIDNITVNGTDMVKITMIASDLDGDNLSYFADDSRFIQNENVFTWQTDLGDEGNHTVNMVVSDGKDIDSQEVFVVVIGIEENQPPNVFNLQPNNVTNTSLTPLLTWMADDPENDTLTYRVVLATDSEFSSILINETLFVEEYQTGTLNYSTTYYWKVIVSDNEYKVESETAMFTTQSNFFVHEPLKIPINETGEAPQITNVSSLFNPVYDDVTNELSAIVKDDDLEKVKVAIKAPGEEFVEQRLVDQGTDLFKVRLDELLYAIEDRIAVVMYYFKAEDLLGNTAETEIYNFTIIDGSPKVNQLAPEDDIAFFTNTVDFVCAFEDPSDNIKEVALYTNINGRWEKTESRNCDSEGIVYDSFMDEEGGPYNNTNQRTPFGFIGKSLSGIEDSIFLIKEIQNDTPVQAMQIQVVSRDTSPVYVDAFICYTDRESLSNNGFENDCTGPSNQITTNFPAHQWGEADNEWRTLPFDNSFTLRGRKNYIIYLRTRDGAKGEYGTRINYDPPYRYIHFATNRNWDQSTFMIGPIRFLQWIGCNQTSTFTISDINPGAYAWNCQARDHEEDDGEPPNIDWGENRTFSILPPIDS